MKPILIAEIAKEHGGDIEKAKELIREAKRAGFQYVKFQAYALDDINHNHSNYNRYTKCWLDLDKLKELKKYADDFQIGFFCSVFSKKMIQPLSEFTEIIKVPSTFLSCTEFVEECFKHFEKVHISTGMHEMETIINQTNYYRKLGFAELYHCVSIYPTPLREAKLGRLRLRQPEYSGYSDHTAGTESMFMAWLLGAVYIEKHFSLDNTSRPWCITPKEMYRFIAKLETYNDILEDKKLSKQERANYDFFEKEFNDLYPFR